MPINRFQSGVLRLLAAQRSLDSHITGGIAINRNGPRFSADIDIFHDSTDRIGSAAAADEAALTAPEHFGRHAGTPCCAKASLRRRCVT